MVGIIGGIFGGFAPSRPMKPPVTEVPAAESDRPAASQPGNLPVAIVSTRPVNLTPIAHDLFLNQFTTPSTAVVASDVLAPSDSPARQSLIELRAQAAYSAAAAEGN